VTRVRVLAIFAVACGSSPPPAQVGSRLGPALTAAFGAFDQSRAPWRCAAVDGPRPKPETVTVGAATWTISDTTLARTTTGGAEIGVVADAGGAATSTIAALGRLHGKLAAADLVLALGGMGANQAELEATLGTLAEGARGPVVALPGDLEPVPALDAAIAALRKHDHVVLDGRLIREIELGDTTIAIVPGAGAGARVAAGPDGCVYTATSLVAITEPLARRPGLRILASAEAPRSTIDGEPVGQLAIVPPAGRVDVHLHGPATPAASPARSGDREGKAIPLSPGTSDATTRLPGPRHVPSAGMLSVSAHAWRWRPLAGD